MERELQLVLRSPDDPGHIADSAPSILRLPAVKSRAAAFRRSCLPEAMACSALLVDILGQLGDALPEASTLGLLAAGLGHGERMATIARRIHRNPQYLSRVKKKLARLVLRILEAKADDGIDDSRLSAWREPSATGGISSD